MELTTDLINAFTALFVAIIGTFGPLNTVLIALGIYLAAFLWRNYKDGQKNKEVNLALKHMEKSVQRSAEEARQYRVLIMKEKFNWSDEQVEKFILHNEFENPVEARNELEQKTVKEKWKEIKSDE